MLESLERSTSAGVDVYFDLPTRMPDGVRLYGNLYLPAERAQSDAFPAILTFIPYHKDGRGGLGFSDVSHRHFAARGYAVLHVDMRGTGSSEGEPYGPFDGRERDDGHHIVEWLAEQPWCDGNVGVWGTSYGGITAMAIAETHPPHLRAIVPVHAPDDNYEAMLVHRGSRLMFWSDPHWGANMVASNLMPPLRYGAHGDWLKVWRQRLESSPWIFDWHGEPPDPEYWERQRVDPAKIEVPTFTICGWQDAYPDGTLRVYSAVNAPRRLLFGPWKHAFPETATREPIGILAEIDRWWDRWLKGVENGVEHEPPVTIFVQGTEVWRNEQAWPPARTTLQRMYPRPDGRLGTDPDASDDVLGVYTFDARAGLAALPYDACTGSVPYPQDQSADDHLSLTFTTEPLDADLEITGEPTIQLTFSASVPLDEINLVAKLCDVTPDGRSFLVTHDNLAARRAQQRATDQGRDVYEATIEFRPTAYVFQAGHQIRLAVSGSNFPHLWPTPYQYTLTLHDLGGGSTELLLPVVPAQEPRLPAPAIGAPQGDKPPAVLDHGEAYSVHQSLTDRSVTFEGRRMNAVSVMHGVKTSSDQHFFMSVDADHPETANSRTIATWRLDRATGAVEVRAHTIVTLDDVTIEAEVDLDGSPMFRRTWHKAR